MANPLRLYPGVSVAGIEETHIESALRTMDQFLRDVGPAITAANAAISKFGVGAFPSVSYATVLDEHAVLPQARQLVGSGPISISDGGPGTQVSIGVALATPAISLGTVAAAGSAATLIRSDATIVAFDAVNPSPLAASATPGVVNLTARRDHAHVFPQTLQSLTTLTQLTLTDNGTDQTLTGSLGRVILTPANNLFNITGNIGAAGSAASTTAVLSFNHTGATSPYGTTIQNAINASTNWNAVATYSGVIHTGLTLSTTDGSQPTYTNAILRGLDITASIAAQTLAGQTWTEKTGAKFTVSGTPQSGAGTVTVTDTFGLIGVMQTLVGTAGTMTNATGIKWQLPNFGGTIRRGIWVNVATSNFGTEAADVEGFYCDPIARGTTNRRNYAAEGATTGTPTNVACFEQKSAHAVGTNRRSLRGIDPAEATGGHIGAYATGSFLMPTGEYMVVSNHLILTGAQNITMQGTSHIRMVA